MGRRIVITVAVEGSDFSMEYIEGEEHWTITPCDMPPTDTSVLVALERAVERLRFVPNKVR